ncbi:tetratricopeptide repeat protein [Phenylobacterium sp.]|jgi:hypothetical protein|uniref:tetratricopeptide repeat protein n=1 Tax=Phenylobacterium sp. TaxID=1871053 RepID=UPI0037CBED3E
MEIFDAAINHYQNNRISEAESMFRSLVERSNIVSASVNLGSIQENRGSFDEAIETYIAGSIRFPGEPRILRRLGYLLLRNGDFDAGWKLHELRESKAAAVAPLQRLPYPEWNGQPIGRLLVVPEQGFGDQIMYARFVRDLVRTGTQTVLVAPPPLARLFAQTGATVVEAGGAASIPRCDAWISIASLPYRLGVSLEALNGGTYLSSQGRDGGIGLVTKGSPGHPNDRNRSLPSDLARRLETLPNVRSLDPAVTGANDFLDTAQIISGLDLVITVDTSVAHLAGALGKRCWVMLPFVGDWRWLRDRNDSPWYNSVRLFRQPQLGDWNAVIEKVEEELCGGPRSITG